MATKTTSVIEEVFQPTSVSDMMDLVQAAGTKRRAVYPVGGGTSAAMGLPPSRPGWEISLGGLQQVIDYPAADMTITVQAGMTLSRLDEILAEKGQRFPLDVPQRERATLGGVLSTNWSGPQRFGLGTARDYVIGIQAVDGRGSLFAGGGRVVKNVAGYDFCKLLIGSLGTLGIITEVTLKLKPRVPREMWLVCAPPNRASCDAVLARLMQSRVPATSMEWVLGPMWEEHARQWDWPIAPPGVGWIVWQLEGRAAEVEWMRRELLQEVRDVGNGDAVCRELEPEAATAAAHALREFSATDGAAAVLKFSLRPSGLIALAEELDRAAGTYDWQAHAGNGIALVRWRKLPTCGLARSLVQVWQPWSIANDGNVIVVSAGESSDVTPRVQWGDTSSPRALLQRIREQFDPLEILNPHRFVYA